MTKEETTYIIRVYFVDDSYWDDGNRSTYREFSYKTLQEMWDAQSRMAKEGFVANGVGYHKTFFPDSFEFYMQTTVTIPSHPQEKW